MGYTSLLILLTLPVLATLGEPMERMTSLVEVIHRDFQVQDRLFKWNLVTGKVIHTEF